MSRSTITTTRSARTSPANASGRGAASGRTTAYPVPVAPTSPSATATSPSAITVSWTDTNSGRAPYKVERSPNGSTSWSQIATTATGATSYADTGLSNNTAYYYRVRANASGFDSSYCSVVHDTTGTTPAAPSALSATAISASQVNLTWTDNQGAGASAETGFVLERSPSGAGTWAQIATPAANAVSASDSSVSALTAYDYRIKAVNTAGSSSYSATASVTTPDAADPTVMLTPSLLTAARAKASGNTTQWQDFKSRLDGQLTSVTLNTYEGDQMTWLGDYALGYQVLKNSDPTTAAKYADKALALLKAGLRGNPRLSTTNAYYLGRGDGSTVTWSLPQTDNIRAASFALYTKTVAVQAVTKGSAGGQDAITAFQRPLKVSNTSDGPADYAERLIIRGATDTWPSGDWRSNPDYEDFKIDWSGAVSQPTTGATYYVTYADHSSLSSVAGANYTLNTVAGTVTFNVAPSANTAIFVTYQYGTPTQGATTLGYQQLGDDRAGLNVLKGVDFGYPSRTVANNVALAYDWLYQYAGFNGTLKAETTNRLAAWYELMKDGNWCYLPTDPESNYGGAHYRARTLIALAKNARDTGGDATRISEMVSYRTANVLPKVLSAPTSGNITAKGGYPVEGWSYGYGTTQCVLHAAIALRDAGQVTPTEEQTWANEVVQVLHHGRPSNADTTPPRNQQGQMIDVGDGNGYPMRMPDKSLLYCAAQLADATNAGYANHWIQESVQPQTKDLFDLIYRNPSATATDPTLALPLQYTSTGAGLLLARAAWDYSSAFLGFYSGNPFSSGHVLIQGEMRVFRGGDDLLIEPSVISSSQNITDNTGNNKSSYSNVVLLDDNGTGLLRFRWSQSYYNFGTPGCTLSTEGATNYVWAMGDYAAAYSKNVGDKGPASTLQRAILFVRPDVIVVYDRAVTVSTGVGGTEYPKRLQWHFLANPTVTGDSWSVAKGSSKLFGTTVSGSTLTTAGSGPVTAFGASSWGGVSFYQVLTQNSVAADSVRYCTVLQTAASAGTAYSVSRVVSGSDFEGAIVNGVTVVLFGQSAGPVSTVGGKSYSFTATNAQTTTHYVADLTPSQTYTLSGAASGTATASAAGVLTFTTTGTGSSQTVTVS